MKNKLWVKILYILTLITQVGIVIGTFVVEYLTNKKAGVMHHVFSCHKIAQFLQTVCL